MRALLRAVQIELDQLMYELKPVLQRTAGETVGIQNQYLDGHNVSNCSEQTGSVIDDEVRMILAECQQNAIDLLKQNVTSLDKISEFLLEKENITGIEFTALLNEDKSGEVRWDGFD